MIRIVEKPESVSCEQLSKLIADAHSVNRLKGLEYGTASITPGEIQKKLDADKNNTCFVVLDDCRPVGMEVVSVRNITKWYYTGEAAYLELIAMDPNYSGKGLAKSLAQRCIQYVEDQGIDFVFLNSAEKNYAINKVYSGFGFSKVDFGAGKTNNFYSVFYGKWMITCPYSAWYINCRYLISKIAHILVFKPGGKKRLWF